MRAPSNPAHKQERLPRSSRACACTEQMSGRCGCTLGRVWQAWLHAVAKLLQAMEQSTVAGLLPQNLHEDKDK